MKRRSALALLLLGGCSRFRGHGGGPVAQALLAAPQGFSEGRPDDETWGRSELDRIADAVREKQTASGGNDAQSLFVALRQTLFEKLGFAREASDTAIGFTLLPSLLRRRRGSSLGLGTLYLAVSELLDLPLEAVLRPGHFYVRLSEGGVHTNAEPLRQGEAMPDTWYDQRFPIPGEGAKAYARPLTLTEVLGVLAYEVGKERQRERRLPDARHAYELATERFPDLGEAHASLGGVLTLLGEWDRAQAEYDAARRVFPGLPGLEHSVELLRAERGRAIAR